MARRLRPLSCPHPRYTYLSRILYRMPASSVLSLNVLKTHHPAPCQIIFQRSRIHNSFLNILRKGAVHATESSVSNDAPTDQRPPPSAFSTFHPVPPSPYFRHTRPPPQALFTRAAPALSSTARSGNGPRCTRGANIISPSFYFARALSFSLLSYQFDSLALFDNNTYHL